MSETATTEEPTAGDLLRGAFARISRESQIFLVLVGLYAVANILLYLPLLEPLRAIREATGGGDPAAIQEAGKRLLGPFLILIIGAIIAFGFFATLWGRAAALGRPAAGDGLFGRALAVMWRTVAFIGWAILLGVPLFLFVILFQAVLGLVGINVQAAGGKLIMQVIVAIIAILLYLPLSSAFQLAVVETAIEGRTPIHLAFQAMMRQGRAYLLAFFVVALIFGLAGFVWDQLFTDEGIPTRLSMIGSAIFNSLGAGVMLALAVEMRGHLDFRRPERI
ncbi:MAG: hypothetical protein D6757_01575 [Alphaproteobacteria bacterium]|nr:MAG: hypothetical protein D6757_01575 [Alphaproteobacteria bacterium]